MFRPTESCSLNLGNPQAVIDTINNIEQAAHQAFVDEMVKLCKCSHDQPCDGLLAGGMCDNLHWSNEDERHDDDDDL